MSRQGEDPIWQDWGEASERFDSLKTFVSGHDILLANEAQTRFDVINRMVREVLSWRHGQVDVEEPVSGSKKGFIDYTLTSGDNTLLIEAKKAGEAFPSPTRRKRLKLSGIVLGAGPICAAIGQVQEYGRVKKADVLVTTNGICWCIFARQAKYENAYGYLLFPFDDAADAESLFNFLSLAQVEKGSLKSISNELPRTADRLLSIVSDADARVDRNNVADFLMPALDNALYADALLDNPEALKRCFVTSEARAKFDSYLGIHLADIKSSLVLPAKRIKTGKDHGHLSQIIEGSEPSFAPPVTLIIGPVGAGKSTYLKHFSGVSGKEVIASTKAHWIYIDFEMMGRLGNPREFIYRSLLEYLGNNHPAHCMDYPNLVAPAYAEDIDKLSRGPLAPILNNKPLFEEKISEHILSDYHAIEPYVDKLLKYLSQKQLCVLVLDNVDLYEDDTLETSVFAEGLALSKRLRARVIVSIRDTTFVRHKTDSTFDAFELRKLWLDPPPFKAVLSARLTYSRNILKGKHVQIPLSNSMKIDVPDLSVFFDIVQRSILQGHIGDHVAAYADTNIRKGLELVTNFLTSGHIQADRAISSYMKGQTSYYFPEHEIFKGMMLGQWKHYKEGRAECINLFDSRLGSKRLLLLRLHILNFLYDRARSSETLETSVKECAIAVSDIGASEAQVVQVLELLTDYRLVRTVTAGSLDGYSPVVLTPCGGYYCQFLCKTFAYAEACLMDTAIDDNDVWTELSDITTRVERCTGAVADRMALRVERMKIYVDYLFKIECMALDRLPAESPLLSMSGVQNNVMNQGTQALEKARKYFAD
jgi:hypothetical protein